MSTLERMKHGLRRRVREASDRIKYGPLPLAPMYAHQALERLRGGSPRIDISSIPVAINNFNRLEPLKELIDWLERAGMRRIYILDNASTYPPLLEYYESCPHEVIFQGKNCGPYGFWDTSAFERFRRGYYIYTDPDVVPSEECPLDAIEHLFDVLNRHPRVAKVGFGLKIDDLPEHYAGRDDVIEWEGRYWTKKLDGELYDSPIDTTFALYRPYARGGHWIKGLRTGGAYQARHLPWYEDSENPTAEDEYYRSVIEKRSSHWVGGYTPADATKA